MSFTLLCDSPLKCWKRHSRESLRAALDLMFLLCATFASSSCSGTSRTHHMNRRVNLDRRASSTTPLVITNQCSEEIYPAILTQSGNGPGTGGFGLNAGNTRTLTVSESWQGRVWGRTNCSFNSAGDGPGGSITNGQACSTGDCGGIVDCRGAVSYTRTSSVLS